MPNVIYYLLAIRDEERDGVLVKQEEKSVAGLGEVISNAGSTEYDSTG
jgi:hypothetical protein